MRTYIEKSTLTDPFPCMLDAFLWLFNEKGGTHSDISRRVGFDILALDATRTFGRLRRDGCRELHLYGCGLNGQPYGVVSSRARVSFDAMNRQTAAEARRGIEASRAR